jgi:hypothetical protein
VKFKRTIDGDTMNGAFQQGQNSIDWTVKLS